MISARRLAISSSSCSVAWRAACSSASPPARRPVESRTPSAASPCSVSSCSSRAQRLRSCSAERRLWRSRSASTAQSVEAERLRHSLRSAEQERSRWARELHDETLQGLGALGVLLSTGLRAGGEALEQAARQATEQLTTEIANLRALITELRPPALDQLGLVAALEGLGRRAAEVDGLEVGLDVRVDEQALDPELKTAVYRLVQEALTNVAKHARAARVDVAVEQSSDRLRLRVTDDGSGFDVAEPTAGFGLAGMRERAALMGGELEIETSGAGTAIAATFPL